MNRRGFLKRGAMGLIGAAAAIALPSIVKEILPEPEPSNAYNMAPAGLPCHINDHHRWFGARMVEDPDCPPDTVYFMDLSAIGWRTPTEFSISPEARGRFALIYVGGKPEVYL